MVELVFGSVWKCLVVFSLTVECCFREQKHGPCLGRLRSNKGGPSMLAFTRVPDST